MQIEDTGIARRIAQPLLIALVIVAAVAIPTWLWLTRGREVPLSVVLDPPRYVVAVGQEVPLRPRIRPAGADPVVEWQGEQVLGAGEGGPRWKAPAKPGIYSVGVRVRRSGTVAEDTVSFRVLPRAVDSLPLARPPAPPVAPRDLPSCAGPAPTVKVHGRPCAGAIVVAELVSERALRGWHSWAKEPNAPHAGRLANLHVGLPAGAELVLQSLAVDQERSCAWSVSTAMRVARCTAGPAAGPVFADFSWQMVSPAQFRFAAEPSRHPEVTFEQYRWSFGDGEHLTTHDPLVAHRFKGARERWHLVRLTVTARSSSAAGELQASAVRAVMDRSVPAPR